MDKKAFSLAEMMVVMLILSIIIAASMPIITKRTAATESPNQNKIPPGSIMAYGGTTAPNGWLLCDGRSINGHPELAAVIGNNVPDLRGEFIRGWDNGRGVDVGRSFRSAQGDAIRNITGRTGMMGDWGMGASLSANVGSGALYTGGATSHYAEPVLGYGAYYAGDFYFDASRVVPTATENRPRNIALNYIIKY